MSDSPSAAGFVLTDQDVAANIWQSAGAAALSVLLCTFILSASLWVWTHRSARHVLDRVSFRLMLWSMLFEIVYDLDYIAVEVYSVFDVPNALCASGVYMMMATLGVVNYLCTCIAINLMLSICFGVNPIQRKLEQWYVGASIVLGFGVPIVPAALDHFGNDPVLEVCWIKARDDEMRIKYFILDLYLWQTISCAVAVIAVLMSALTRQTLVTLLRQRRATSKALFRSPFKTVRHLDHDAAREGSTSSTLDHGTAPVAVAPGRTSRFRLSDTQAKTKEQKISLGQLEDRFLRIALRIATYPVALVIVNGIITVGDLYISVQGGVDTQAVYVLYCIYYFLYGGRGIVFAIIAIFIDPCLCQGIRAAWRSRKARSGDIQLAMTSPELGVEQSFAEMISSTEPGEGRDYAAAPKFKAALYKGASDPTSNKQSHAFPDTRFHSMTTLSSQKGLLQHASAPGSSAGAKAGALDLTYGHTLAVEIEGAKPPPIMRSGSYAMTTFEAPGDLGARDETWPNPAFASPIYESPFHPRSTEDDDRKRWTFGTLVSLDDPAPYEAERQRNEARVAGEPLAEQSRQSLSLSSRTGSWPWAQQRDSVILLPHEVRGTLRDMRQEPEPDSGSASGSEHEHELDLGDAEARAWERDMRVGAEVVARRRREERRRRRERQEAERAFRESQARL